MRHVAAADVQQPGDRFGHGQHRRRHPFLGQVARQPGALCLGAFAGKGFGVRHHRRQGRGRLPGPDPVERVVGDGAQFRPGLLGSDAEALDFVRGVQPRVVAKHRAGGQRRADPSRRRLVDQMVDLKEIAVDLLRRLQGIAAIDKQRGAFAQHHRQPGGTGKAGQPGEALATRRHVFALVLVRARHDEPVEPAHRKLPAQPRHTLGPRQPFEILLPETVAVAGRHFGPQPFERLGQGRGHRFGDQHVPAVGDLFRGAEHAGDQRLDACRVISRPRLAQQPSQFAPVRSVHRHRTRS